MTTIVAELNRDIDAINKRWTEAVLSDGSVVPITGWFDEDGDETEDEHEAVIFVCGSDDLGWRIGSFRAFEFARAN